MDKAELGETEQVEFGFGLEGGLFLFLLLALLDGEAKLARMLAIKRLLQGHFQGIRLRVADGHADPRDGLQHDPMPAHRYNERGGDTELKKPSGHAEWKPSPGASARKKKAPDRPTPPCFRSKGRAIIRENAQKPGLPVFQPRRSDGRV